MAVSRKVPLETGKVYHILNKSIAGFKIFSRKKDFLRGIETIKYYQRNKQPFKLSRAIEIRKQKKKPLEKRMRKKLAGTKMLVGIVCYCLMPTHIHLVLKQLQDKGISIFMNNVENSYTRYFNTSRDRKGPLWQGPFKNILVESDGQLYHLTRYIHLNPVTAYLVENPEDWQFSSYKEYLLDAKEKICNYEDYIDIETDSYREFVESRVCDQRELQRIKDLLLE